MSIWEVRGQKQHFTYSKILLWVAVDRAIRLSEKRNFPCPNRIKWMETRDTIYEQVMEKGFNYDLNCFVQSYESNTTLDSAVLVAPLVFFMSPNDPQFVGTLDRILKSPEKGGLTSAGFVFRYDHEKTDDGKTCLDRLPPLSSPPLPSSCHMSQPLLFHSISSPQTTHPD